MQFICLYALVSIYYYPSILNALFQAQTIFNLNFIPIDQLTILNCYGYKSEDVLEGNLSNHQSINCIVFFCNIYSVIFIFGVLLLILLISIIFPKRASIKISRQMLWNSFLESLSSSFIVIICCSFIQLIFV